MQKKHCVLFVCTANRFRSPIAEAAFRRILQEKGTENNWIVGSAGSWAENDLPPQPSVEWIKEKLGLDLSEHLSKSVSRELFEQFNLIIVMEKGQKEALQAEYPDVSKRIFMLTELTKGPVYNIPDPISNPEESYYEVAQEIIRLINDNFQLISSRASRID
jgi:protein-tyrosine phosphatase